MTEIAFLTRPCFLPEANQRFTVVEASAGTGKTYFLEHRVLDLILRAGAKLDEILIVTFTEKATAELRARIRTLLERTSHAPSMARPDGDVWVIHDDARAALRQASMSFERAAIYTIHGFCQRVLVHEAFHAGRLFDQTQVPDVDAFDDAFYDLLRERFAVDPQGQAILHAWLSGRGTLDKLRSVLLDCLRSGGELTPVARFDDILAAGQQLRDAWRAAGQQLPELSPERRLIKVASHRSFARLLAAIAGSDDELVATVRALAVKPEKPSALRDLCALAQAGKISATGAPLLAALDCWLRAAVPLEMLAAQTFLPAIIERMGHDKAQRGRFDFNDMLLLVQRALCGPRGPELAARIRHEHPWALIDEFQDTDPLQWEIFRQIWADPEPPPRGGLTIVGDPKQGIYRFRGADIHTYLAARDELLASGAARVQLLENQRSTHDLVTAVNHLLCPTPPAQFFTGPVTYSQPAFAAGEVHGPPGPAVVVLEFQGAEAGSPVLERRRAMLNFIAEESRRLLADPLPWKKRGKPRRVGPRDIFVLTYSNDDSRLVAAELRRSGLPCALFQAEQLLDTDEAHDLADVLDAVAAPKDRSCRLRAWTTPFFGIRLEDAALHLEAPDHHPLKQQLIAWNQLAQRRDYEKLFAAIFTQSRVVERALLRLDGQRAVTNLQHVAELLLIETSAHRMEVHELARLLRWWIAHGDELRPDDSDVQRQETDEDAVQVMTIHRAKGLEAAVVFMLGASTDQRTRAVYTYHDRGRKTVAGNGDEEQVRRVKEEEQQEHQRLAYVALTRACVRLYLPSFPGTRSGHGYAPIESAIARLRQHNPVPQLIALQPLRADLQDGPACADEAVAALVPPLASTPTPLSLSPRQKGRLAFSYSKLARAHRVATSGVGHAGVPAGADEAPPFSGLPSAGHQLPGGVDTGLFLHELLEKVEFRAALGRDRKQWAAQPEVAQLLADTSVRWGIADQHLDDAVNLVFATLTSPLELGDLPLPSLATAEHYGKEVEFTFAAPGDADHKYVRGVLDLALVVAGQLWIIDYKSDVLGDAQPSAVVAQRYLEQARLYGLAGLRLEHPRLRFAGVVFWFLRNQQRVIIPATAAERQSWQEWFADLELPS
jgi:exodeoxyribonuclease V beta subunit